MAKPIETHEFGDPAHLRELVIEIGAAAQAVTDAKINLAVTEAATEAAHIRELGDPKLLGPNEADRKRALILVVAGNPACDSSSVYLRDANERLTAAKADLEAYREAARMRRDETLRLLSFSRVDLDNL